MKTPERDKLAQESHQALLGIPGTEDNGLVGDVKEMKADIKQINSRVSSVETGQAVLATKQEERSKPSKKAFLG